MHFLCSTLCIRGVAIGKSHPCIQQKIIHLDPRSNAAFQESSSRQLVLLIAPKLSQLKINIRARRKQENACNSPITGNENEVKCRCDSSKQPFWAKFNLGTHNNITKLVHFWCSAWLSSRYKWQPHPQTHSHSHAQPWNGEDNKSKTKIGPPRYERMKWRRLFY